MTTEDILAEYHKNPHIYISQLPNGIESVDKMIYLMNRTNNDPQLLDVLSNYGYVEIVFILGSKHTLKERIGLLNAIFLTGDMGITNITDYYTHYEDSYINNTLNLSEHCDILEGIITKLVASTNNFSHRWCVSGLVSLTPIIIDCANNATKLDITKLSSIMRLYDILDKTKHVSITTLDFIDSHQKLIIALSSISEYLYGDRKDSIMQIAQTLDLMNDTNYWKSCIEDLSTKYNNQDLLPILE